ncbi:MAG: hypothetical protein WC855_04550 [Thermodesulfovibrionales bacterium]
MKIRIEKKYQVRIPINIERLVRKLLVKVPEDHLVGLGSIILVDQVTHKRDKKSEGLYWQRKGQELAKIEIGVNTIYRGMPRFIFYLPFIAKFMLATVLYHEIGHHSQYSTHGITKEEEENFAEKYRKEMLKKAFFLWRLFLLPISPLVRWLTRSQKGRSKGKKTGITAF